MFSRPQQNCYPDRSKAQWRDLRFTNKFGSDLALYAEPRGVRLSAADVINDYDETLTIEANMDRC